jgi:asparagine synthase (glutamine-hydrolysing)
MCGIAGFVGKTAADENGLERFASAGKVQRHRGPDHQGQRFYKTVDSEVAFLHQRLSIIDLSDSANQPFEDQRYALIFNGEIYNYIELRIRLLESGCVFSTDSDTEVLFQALKYWGIEKTLSECNGMWAFAWLDKQTGQVVLARDRFGVKPLYLRVTDEGVYFASEIKTVLVMSKVPVTLRYQAVVDFLDQAVLEGDSLSTFFNEIEKVPPSCYATIEASAAGYSVNVRSFYSPKVQPDLGNLDFESAALEMRSRMQKAVELRLRSDVPVGVLLSGGVDSSILASLATQQNAKSVELLSYVSDDSRFDESPYVDLMGKYLGRKPIKVKIDFSATSPMAGLEAAIWQNDQPIHSFSAYAHMLLMEQARKQNVTVLLSGQGADESFCGYRKYWPFYLRRLLKESKYKTFASEAFALFRHPSFLGNISYSEVRRYLPGNKASSGLYAGVMIPNAPRRVMGLKPGEALAQRQVRDLTELSVPSLLHYEDRMSMTFAREIRLPFLDFNVVELGLSVRDDFKLRAGWTKYLLRRAFEADLPPEIAWRRDKKGFTNPQSEWIRAELKSEILSRFNGDAVVYRLGLVQKEEFLSCYQKVLSNGPGGDDRLVFRVLSLEVFLNVFSRFLALP